MSKGPLAVRWGAPPRAALQAGTTAIVTVEVTNAGSLPWGDQVFLVDVKDAVLFRCLRDHALFRECQRIRNSASN